MGGGSTPFSWECSISAWGASSFCLHQGEREQHEQPNCALESHSDVIGLDLTAMNDATIFPTSPKAKVQEQVKIAMLMIAME